MCPIPTIPASTPSFPSPLPPTSRSRISPTACSRRRMVSRRVSASRSGISCSTSGSSNRIAGSMSARSASFQASRSIRSWRLDPRSGQGRVRGSASCCATTIPNCAIMTNCDSVRWCRWPTSGCTCRSRWPAIPISIRRRSTPPMSASCSAARTMRCSRTGCTCRSATTAGLPPSSSAAHRCAGRVGS